MKSVWLLGTDRPICVVESEDGIAAPQERNVSRLQIVGKPPPTGVAIELTGKLSTGNITQYYAESTAIVVTSGRRIETATKQQATTERATTKPPIAGSAPLSQPISGRYCDAVNQNIEQINQAARNQESALPPENPNSVRNPNYKAVKGLASSLLR